MDPLAAFSLAANILQFIDFASKLFALSKDIYRAGESARNLNLGIILNDIDSLSRKLRSDVVVNGIATSDDDRALQTLAKECIIVADDLARELGKLKLDSRRPSKWRTFRQVLATIWKEDRINALYTKLEALRNELAFRLTIMTKNNVDFVAISQDERFAKLDDSTAMIIRMLHQAPSGLISSLHAQTSQIAQRQDQSDRLAVALQQETLAVIRDLRPGRLDRSQSPSLLSQRLPKPRLSVEEASSQLLDMLKFRQMYDREESVELAYPETFRWVLNDQNTETFSPLGSWIRDGKGLYWVNGKAGSGKSTLMKFLRNSQQVKTLIKEWAEKHHLITASFFFWRNGTELQQSQEGLLRWLLYTVLSQDRALIQKCFPETIEKLRGAHRTDDKEVEQDQGDKELVVWSDYAPEFDVRQQAVHETATPFFDLVKQAYHRLSEQSLAPFRIFLFIDGVDEFTGDHTEISQFFRQLSSSPNFKVILSSRPIRPCVLAFRHCPSLRLQDLTRKDMKTYFDGTVGSQARMQSLLAENPQEASELEHLILSKASGVFLWVKLVAKSLLDGFQNYDRISDLKERVEELPSELSELYMHMFNSMEKRYQTHAAELIRMVIRSVQIQHSGALTILQISYADEPNLIRAITAPVGPVSGPELHARFEAMEGRLQTRCCGLIEVAQGPYYSYVQVLHKSVLDFLAEDDMAALLLSRTPKYDPDKVLALGTLLAMKKDPHYSNTLYRHGLMTDFLGYLHALERSTRRPQVAILNELMRAIQDQLSREERLRRVALEASDNSSSEPLWSWKNPIWTKFEYTWETAARCSALVHTTAQAGLSLYFEHILEQSEDDQNVFRNFDPRVLFKRLFFKVVDAHVLRGSHTFLLVEEYTRILVLLIKYISEYRDSINSLYAAWYDVQTGIARVNEQSADWYESEEEVKPLKSLLAIVEAFLQCGEGQHGFPKDLSFISLLLFPNLYVDTLLRWLKLEAGRLNKYNEKDAAVLADIKRLGIVVNHINNIKLDPSTKRQEWASWLAALPPSAFAPRLANPPDPEAIIHLGGPFELDAIETWVPSYQYRLHSTGGLYEWTGSPIELDSEASEPKTMLTSRPNAVPSSEAPSSHVPQQPAPTVMTSPVPSSQAPSPAPSTATASVAPHAPLPHAARNPSGEMSPAVMDDLHPRKKTTGPGRLWRRVFQ